jgi:uncharacterized protein (TIGR02246 family)
MKKILILALSLIIGQMAFAQNAKTDIEALERQRFAAQVSKDMDFLNKIFADDLVYTHSSGKQDTKESYLASISGGKSVYAKIAVEEIAVRTYNKDKTAVINGRITITQPPVDGKSAILPLRYTAVYVKNGKKGWQLNTWQSLKLVN